MLTFQFFCLSIISSAMNKAPHQYNLSLCHSQKRRFNGAGEEFLSPLISLSNPSVYVGPLLSICRGKSHFN